MANAGDQPRLPCPTCPLFRGCKRPCYLLQRELPIVESRWEKHVPSAAVTHGTTLNSNEPRMHMAPSAAEPPAASPGARRLLSALLEHTTERQRQVVEAEMSGMTLRDIARRFRISYQSVKRLRDRAAARMGKVALVGPRPRHKKAVHPTVWRPKIVMAGPNGCALNSQVDFWVEVPPHPYAYHVDLGGDADICIPPGQTFSTDLPLSARHPLRFRTAEPQRMVVVVKTIGHS